MESRKLKKTANIPFEQLPNLPKPQYTSIDLGITRSEVSSTLESGITERRRIGYFRADQSTQTDESDIVALKNVTVTIGALIEDITQLRNDLSYAKHVMKRDYDSKLDQRATELYSHANQRVSELEKIHLEKIEIIRNSYRAQLSNAISKIAGEYKVYYHEVLQGKTGRHDARIKELKQRVEVLEHHLGQREAEVTRLTESLANGAKKTEETTSPSQFVSAFSSEKEEELRHSIKELEGELDQAQTDLAEKEDTVNKYRRQSEVLTKQFEESKVQVLHLKKEIETVKRKSLAEIERAGRIAQGQRDALEREMSEKMVNIERDALARASEHAEMQRMKDMARFQQQMDQRKSAEEELRKQANQPVSTAAGLSDMELSKEMEKLRRKSHKQEEELARLTKELDKTNRIWETKLAIMQKNFHALKDESYVRQHFQRQSALLHYATVGYAATNPSKASSPPHQTKHIRTARGPRGRRGVESRATIESFTDSLPVPTASPVHAYHFTSAPPDADRPRSVHFEEGGGRRGSSNLSRQLEGRRESSNLSQQLETQA